MINRTFIASTGYSNPIILSTLKKSVKYTYGTDNTYFHIHSLTIIYTLSYLINK